MTIARGFGFGETHLMPDAIVAFVDEELSTTATERARTHLDHCPYCASEASAQREARNRLRGLPGPGMPSALLEELQAIPQQTEVPPVPDGLAMTSDGQLVAVQRPDLAGTVDDRGSLGAGAPLGTGDQVIGGGRSRKTGKRAAQGAGALVSGLMLGALAVGVPGSPQHQPSQHKVTVAPQGAFGAGHARPSHVKPQRRQGHTGQSAERNEDGTRTNR